MRPPKSVRDRLKASGMWNKNHTPPPEFEPVVDNLGTSPVPLPGSFQPVFNAFQPMEELPSIELSIEDPFYEYAEMLDTILLEHGINRRKAESLGLSVPSLITRLLGASAVGLAMHLSETHFVQNGTIGHVQFSPPELPRSIAEYIQNTGAFTGPDGRKWKLSDCTTTVNSLIRCAAVAIETNNFDKASSEVWLPIMIDDPRTSHIVSCKLSGWFAKRGFFPTFASLRDKVFSGDIPPDISALLHNMDAVDRSIVTRCFMQYSTDQQFTDLFTDEVGIKTLSELHLTWIDPKPSDLKFGFSPTHTVANILARWDEISRRYQRAFQVAFVPATKHGLTGTKSQTFKFDGDGERWFGHSFYPLSEESKTVVTVLGSPVVFQSLPRKNGTQGFVNNDVCLKYILEEDLGSESS